MQLAWLDESREGITLNPANIWSFQVGTSCLGTYIVHGMCADQYYRQPKVYPRGPCSIGKLCFDAKHAGVFGKLFVFLLKNVQHMVRRWTRTLTSCYLRYFCFSWNLFLWLWNFFKRNFQGEEISPPSKNGANNSSYGAYPRSRHTSLPFYVARYDAWGFQESTVWRYE